MAWMLGPVKPWVRAAAEEIAKQFDVKTMYGVGTRPDSTSDHPLGLAVDFMVYGDKAKGDAIANFVVGAAPQLGNISYVIWYQKIWNPDRASEGWRAMPDRGSVTANHKDHVHVSWKNFSTPTAPIPGGQSGLDKAKDGIESLGHVLGWLSDSHNWQRIGLIVFGAILVLFALIKLSGQETGILPAAATSIRKVAKTNGG